MTQTPTPSRLAFFPVSWFAMIMGLGGLTLAWHKAETLLGLDVSFSIWIAVLTSVLFVILAGVYIAKMLKHPEAVAKEWAHPVKMNFVPTFSIAVILLATVWLPFSAGYSKWLWVVGAALHLVLTLFVMT